MKQSRGFTIIELVTVIILIGILAVAVLPKFDGTASYEAHTHRAQLISALRLTQQRAMQQTDPDAGALNQGYCHQIIFDDDANVSRYGVPDRTDCTVTAFPNDWQPDATGFEVDSKYDVSFQLNGVANPSVVAFDSMGRPQGNCVGGCTIDVQSSVETKQIKIESQGYVHAI